MVLESTMICVDNSEFMRNGDFIPNRLQAQQDAVNLISQCKIKMHPENNVGLLTMAERIEVLCTLTQDNGRLFSKLHQVQPKGDCHFVAGIRVANLALKHRQGRNHKTRIVLFVGSPIKDDQTELVKLAKKLKKEKVNVDVISFGEERENNEKLRAFVETLNGREGTGSHLVVVPPNSHLSEALISSPLLRNEDGTAPAGLSTGAGGGFEFGVDPNEDPELAMALRISMEEQRIRQEEEARRVTEALAGDQANRVVAAEAAVPAAVAAAVGDEPNLDAMTEEEQIAYALQMSMQHGGEAMEVEEGGDAQKPAAGSSAESANAADVIADPEELENLIANLPGMDPQSRETQDAIANLRKAQADKAKGDKKEKDQKK